MDLLLYIGLVLIAAGVMIQYIRMELLQQALLERYNTEALVNKMNLAGLTSLVQEVSRLQKTYVNVSIQTDEECEHYYDSSEEYSESEDNYSSGDWSTTKIGPTIYL